jgi:hypothetical protein
MTGQAFCHCERRRRLERERRAKNAAVTAVFERGGGRDGWPETIVVKVGQTKEIIQIGNIARTDDWICVMRHNIPV